MIRFRHELGRKTVHLSATFIPILYFYTENKELTLNFVGGLLLLMLTIDFLRIEKNMKFPVLFRFYREKESSTFGGNTIFAVGTLTALSLFDREIACLAILMQIYGDMFASLVGRRFGRHPIPGVERKSIEGSTSELFVNFFIGIGFFYLVEILNYIDEFHLLNIVVITGAMALTATLIETFVDKLDDNLMIPTFTGAIGQIVFIIMDYA